MLKAVKCLFTFMIMSAALFASTDNIKTTSAIFDQLNELSGIVSMNVKKVEPKIKRKGKYIGDKIEYGFKLKSLPKIPSFAVSFVDPSGNENIMVVTQSITSNKKKDIYYQLEVVSFIPGVINFPTFNIFQYEVQAMSVTVDSVLTKDATANLVANYQPYQDFSDIILVALLFLLVLIGFLIYQNYQQYRKKQETMMTPEKANTMWQELLSVFKKEVKRDGIKKYYFVSSEKLKEFVSRVLEIEIMESTTYEIMEILQKSSLVDKELLIDILRSSDLVKFAKYLPASNELLDYQKNGVKFLNNHKPREDSES